MKAHFQTCSSTATSRGLLPDATTMKSKLRLFLLAVLLSFSTNASSQDTNFHIYLCFGQSNMESGGKMDGADRTVDKRFQVLADFDSINRGWKKGQWYHAVPPLAAKGRGICMVDYDNLINDLNLKAEKVPLLAGETVHADQEGKCAGFNKIMAELPNTLPNAHVVSSAGCTSNDRLHFNSAGSREFGKRYGEKMLSLQGHKVGQPK
jgi:hypothetical protein